MDREFWLGRWKKNEIGFHQREINAHLQEHWARLKRPAGSRVFVPLCGKSGDMLWLRAQGHPVLGVELSSIAVRDFFAENGLEPALSEAGRLLRWEADGLAILLGDFFDLTADALREVAGVYDRASLIALPPPMRSRYAAHLDAILPASAATLLITMEYPQGEMSGPPFSVSEDEVRRLYQARRPVKLLDTKDILAENPRFRERGMSRLVEKAYELGPRP